MQAVPPIRPLLAAASRTTIQQRPSLRSITTNASNRRLFNKTTVSARFHLVPSRPSTSSSPSSTTHPSMNFLRSLFSSSSSNPAQLEMSAQKAQKLIDDNAVSTSRHHTAPPHNLFKSPFY
jgi:hypothetical protein